MTAPLYLCSLLLMLGGVFGDTDEVKTETVMEGDSLTLPINAAEIQGATDLWWRFKDDIIAKIDKEQGSAPVTYDKRFPDRLQLDAQTGSLTITDSTTTDSGDYKLEIKSSTTKYKIFNLTVRKVNRITVMEGHPVTLHADVNIQTGDVLQWKFKGIIIADVTGHVDKGFELDSTTGDLTITNIRRDQSGDYEVKNNGTSLILHRTFRVNVRESTRNAYREETYPALLTAVILLGIINTFMNE